MNPIHGTFAYSNLRVSKQQREVEKRSQMEEEKPDGRRKAGKEKRDS